MALGTPSVPTSPGPLPEPPSAPAPPTTGDPGGPVPPPSPSTPGEIETINVAGSITITEYTDTTGTGNYRLLGATHGCFRFRDAYADGDNFEYHVTDGPNVEVVLGTLTYSDPDTLTRETVLASSNSGSKINWSGNTRPIVRALVTSTTGEGCCACDMQIIYTGTAI